MDLLRGELDRASSWLLEDIGGRAVCEIRIHPDGRVEAEPDPYHLAGRWSRVDGELRFHGRRRGGRPGAVFGATGQSPRGETLVWGWVGPHRLEHTLRRPPAAQERPRVSLCITCMGRLHHLRRTLPQVIADNRDYPDLEIVLLDYNSRDGLGDWLLRHLEEHLATGLLIHYRTPQPTHYRSAHAKNMALRLASGSILCNLDADNFTGRGFASFLAEEVKPDIVLVGCRLVEGQPHPLKDEGCSGRVAFTRETFLDTGGFDETLVGWGYDDLDLYQRLRTLGFRLRQIPHRFLQCIPHDDEERRRFLVEQDIGRDSVDTHGTCYRNARASRARLDLGQAVRNDGRIGCGAVLHDASQRIVTLGERRPPRISLALVCGAGEEEALLRTLPQNLEATRHYPNLDFVVFALGPDETAAAKRIDALAAMDRVAVFRPAGTPPPPVAAFNLAMRLATGALIGVMTSGELLGERLAFAAGRRAQEDWLAARVSTGSSALAVFSRHLLDLAGGLDEELPALEPAVDDLLRRLAAGSGPVRPFGCGGVRRAGETAVMQIGRSHFPRLSFCTVAMGRLHHLRQTLPRNLEDNRDYPDFEQVVLDYNSADGLEEWLQSELAGELAAGRLRYYKNPEPRHFHFSHARNMALRLARGELLVNVDADNFTGRHFAFYVAEQLREADFLAGCLVGENDFDTFGDSGVAGRLALHRRLFYQAGGYDEGMEAWGFEDVDLYRRLRRLGHTPRAVDRRFLSCIAHDDEERRAHTRRRDIGRAEAITEGSSFEYMQRSRAHLEAGRLQLNDGRIGCGTILCPGGPALAVRPFRWLRVSLCTAVRDRLHHLRRTLPRNLADNADYPELELVLLDYDSSDGLGDWVRRELGAEIASGRLVYYHIAGREAFDRGHARNLLFRLASGEIVCNVDADNFTGDGYAEYVNDAFNRQDGIFLCPDVEGEQKHFSDAFGRVCVRKRDFLEIGGYDEEMSDYGWEDLDLYARLRCLGLEQRGIDSRFLTYIEHGDAERVAAGGLLLRAELLLQVDGNAIPLLCLGPDRRFLWLGEQPAGLPPAGRWRRHNGTLRLLPAGGDALTLTEHGDHWRLRGSGGGDLLLRRSPLAAAVTAFLVDALTRNEERYQRNLAAGAYRVNGELFGCGEVSRNFGSERLRP
jgi:glycosyltransferase involved in cell wall biosynthesis